MKKIKETIEKILKRIKKSNLIRLIKSKSTIKELNEKIEGLEKEKSKLNDEITRLRLELDTLEPLANKVPSLELVIKESDKSIKEKIEEMKKIDDKRLELETELFNKDLELKKYKIQAEEYENEIADLKSDRYLIKKVKPGRTPNTNKTKISKPMSARVTKYMRGEHE